MELFSADQFSSLRFNWVSSSHCQLLSEKSWLVTSLEIDLNIIYEPVSATNKPYPRNKPFFI